MDLNSAPRLGWVGMGSMGAPMALNLLHHLQAGDKSSTRGQLLVYNRDGRKCAPLVTAGAEQREGLDQMSREASVVFMMLANDGAVRSVINGLLDQRGDMKVIVDCSTIAPRTAAELSSLAAAAGAVYVAAPVFGRPDAAAARQLLVLAAGPTAAVDTVLPYLSALGRKVLRLGEKPEQALVLKLAGNFSIVSIIEMLGEAMTLCECHGVSREQYLEFVTEFYPAPPVVGYATRIARDELHSGTGFAVDLALKDVGHMRHMAQDASCPLPLADLAFNHLLTAKAAGFGTADWGALALASRQAAGLSLPPAPPGSEAKSST